MSKTTKKITKASSVDTALTKRILKLAMTSADNLSAVVLSNKESLEDKTSPLTDEQLAVLITTAKLQYSNLKDTNINDTFHHFLIVYIFLLNVLQNIN